MKGVPQLHVIVLESAGSVDLIKGQILILGGNFIELVHPHALLASLTYPQVCLLATHQCVRHIGPVGMNRRIQRLQIRLGEDGRPEAAYVVENNKIVRVNQDNHD